MIGNRKIVRRSQRVRNQEIATKDAIKTMLWSNYTKQHALEELFFGTSKRVCRHCPHPPSSNSIIVKVLWIDKEIQEYEDGEIDGQPAHTVTLYRLRLADKELSVCAGTMQYAFHHPTKPRNTTSSSTTTAMIQQIDNIPPNTYIAIDNYRPTFIKHYFGYPVKRYEHFIIIESFHIHSLPPATITTNPNPSIFDRHFVRDPECVDECRRGDIKVLVLVKLIEENYDEDDIRLQYNKMGYNETRIIADALVNNTSLTKLLYAGNRMGNIGIEQIVDALRYNDRITSIDISDNDISYEGIKAIASFIKYDNKAIVDVMLDGNPIGGRGAKVLASALDNEYCKSNITSMHLNDCGITTSGLEALANMLNNNTILQHLSLGRNDITDEGVSVLVRGLWTNQTLKKLSLKDNYIGDSGAAALAHVLKYNTGLTELDITQNVHDDNGTIAIYKAMEYNTTIKSLSLGYHDGLDDDYRIMLRERFGTKEFPEEPEYNEAITETILVMYEYNDTLTGVKHKALPWNVKNIHSKHSGRRYDVETDQWIDWVAPKKGQRQKHDIYNWLLSNQQDWPNQIPTLQSNFIDRKLEFNPRYHNEQQQQQQPKAKRSLTKLFEESCNKKFCL